MNTMLNQNEKFGNRFKNSVTVKLITITALMLLLLIPTSMIKKIIQEREQLNSDAVAEVSSKWADSQLINGPILTIPVVYEHEKKGITYTSTKYWYLLPEDLNITGDVVPKKLKRGIYEVVVYNSTVNIGGTFKIIDSSNLSNLKEVQFDKAFLTIGISDLRGIKNQIQVKWDNKLHDVIPGSRISYLAPKGVTVDLPAIKTNNKNEIPFEFSLHLQGSKNISFTPVGASTQVTINSSWSSPSFNGNFLPDTREVTEDGFKAYWSVLQLNRNFPQSWIGSSNAENIQESAFGVDLILPLDDYQKSHRSAKYAVMTIALTFLIFFLVEILNKRKIHPFQYALVGIALCLFYTLLVSLSEHINFNMSYGISTIAITGMIALYSISIFKRLNLTLMLCSALCALYGFLFITLQMADYALLMGSIGLTVILGLTMYFTRKIDWYKLNSDRE